MTTNIPSVTDVAEPRNGGSLQGVVGRLREYWLYIWKEHHYLPGRPAEYSNPPVILKVPGLLEALEEARKLTASCPKWEMYEGSGWSGKATVASGHTPIKPPNAEVSHHAGNGHEKQ